MAETTPSTGAPLRAIALVCTLTPSPAASSSVLIAEQVVAALPGHGVSGEIVRVVDHDAKPGVRLDMGDGDAWPGIRAKVMDADILLLATPTWRGQHSSVARRVLERLDAELSETDEQGRLQTFGKAAIVAVVGNEDGPRRSVSVRLRPDDDPAVARGSPTVGAYRPR
jgi:multimeric flavodoxin WrbA